MTNLPMNLTVKHVPQSNVFPILFPYDPYFVRIQGTVLQCNSRSNRFDSPRFQSVSTFQARKQMSFIYRRESYMFELDFEFEFEFELDFELDFELKKKF